MTPAADMVKANNGLGGPGDNNDSTTAPAHASSSSSLCTDFERTLLYPWVIRGYARAISSARAKAAYAATNMSSPYAPSPNMSHGRGSLAATLQQANGKPSSHHHRHHRRHHRHNRTASVVSVVYTPLSKDRDEGDDSSTSGGSSHDWESGVSGGGKHDGTPIHEDDLVPRDVSRFDDGEEHTVTSLPNIQCPPLLYPSHSHLINSPFQHASSPHNVNPPSHTSFQSIIISTHPLIHPRYYQQMGLIRSRVSSSISSLSAMANNNEYEDEENIEDTNGGTGNNNDTAATGASRLRLMQVKANGVEAMQQPPPRTRSLLPTPLILHPRGGIFGATAATSSSSLFPSFPMHSSRCHPSSHICLPILTTH